METIWLQRSSPEVPWGFRLVGGREFGVPLSVQRVTPGSVAAAGLGPGDVILKVGNVMATQLEHNDAMELVRQAGNILQLTIKKSPEQAPSGPLSPASSYGSSQDFSRGQAGHYATTPRHMGSQHSGPSPMGTRIEIQRVQPSQSPAPPQRSYNNSYDDTYSDRNGDVSFPDYTIPYKQQDPIHDSPGGPVNLRGSQTLYTPSTPQRNDPQYSSMSLPRYGGSSGVSDGFDSKPQPDPRFKTGMPYQPSMQQSGAASPYSPSQGYSSQGYKAPSPGPFSPQSYTSPMSPRSQSSSGYGEPSGAATSTVYLNRPNDYTNNNHDPSSKHDAGSGVYSTLPINKPSTNYSMYNSGPQPYSAPKPYSAASTPTYQAPTPKTYQSSPMSPSGYTPYTPSTPQPYTPQPAPQLYTPQQAPQAYTPQQAPQTYTPSTPQPYTPQSAPQVYTPSTPQGYTPSAPRAYQPPSPQPYGRRVSFDQTVQDPRSNHLKSPPPPIPQSPYDSSPYDRSPSGYGGPYDSYSSPSQYRGPPSGGPMSPWSDGGSGNYGYGAPSSRGYDPAGVSAGMNNMSLASPTYEPPSPPAPPPPPPPPPPSGPPPPPAPPLNSWSNPPYRRQTTQDRDDLQKVPDQLLNTVLQSSKGGGPKPFSYGIDLSELKKKMGPPTAPKPRRGGGQPQQYADQDGEGYRPPRRPAGHVQSDYFIPRDEDDSRKPGPPRRPAGQVQSDYYMSRDGGPRAEIDESSLRVSMGTNPKKQSKSFKVLQWMTETEQDDGEDKEATPRTRRPTDPERRHNADDDEMRFTGLHTKADIPSKAFGRLQKMSSHDGSAQNGQVPTDTGDDEGVGNYEESSIRYKGKHIPSPSFRVLQTWAENDPDTFSGSTGEGGKKEEEEEEEDGLPETLITEDMVNKRYKGGNIPSKVFKNLQKSVGDDTPEIPEPPVETNSKEQPQPQPAQAHVSDF